ncbi:Tim17/Tim22/Tim23/Pmp24 family [Carex littledalei]|uniref:Tim17/Tim22/Tim23/Pmp24 family n=1 Tax=Carex littledalei TaxID=544730 RepID=A0A833QR80_9POAL|nr:Tim17/Tim22/Tim23/Pmp24 family [Carex littledalei]
MAPSGDEIPATSRSSDGWKERIIVPTILAGLVGGGYGLMSKNRRALSLSYAANLAVVAGCYCGARELARDARRAEKDDLMNSVVGGLTSGAILGRFQGGQLGAIRYAILFAAGGTLIDFVSLELRPHVERLRENFTEEKMRSWLTLPEWSPIQVMDEETLAKKQARDKQAD